MIVEILGAKMLSPFVGLSHFVWTAQIAVTLIALACGYYAGFHSSARQATPGKSALGIKVTNLAGERIGIVGGIIRYFAVWLSAITLMIGFVMAAFTRNRQALHDVVARTLVVNAKADARDVIAGGGVMPITAGVFAMMILPFVVMGVAGGLAITGFHDYENRAKISGAIANAEPIRKEVEMALMQKKPLKTGPVAGTSSLIVKDTQVTPNGEVVIVFVPKFANGGSIIHSPLVDSTGAVSWRCSAREVPAAYLPASCRQ